MALQLTYALLTSRCYKQDATIPLRNSTEFFQNVATSIQYKTENQLDAKLW